MVGMRPKRCRWRGSRLGVVVDQTSFPLPGPRPCPLDAVALHLAESNFGLRAPLSDPRSWGVPSRAGPPDMPEACSSSTSGTRCCTCEGRRASLRGGPWVCPGRLLRRPSPEQGSHEPPAGHGAQSTALDEAPWWWLPSQRWSRFEGSIGARAVAKRGLLVLWAARSSSNTTSSRHGPHSGRCQVWPHRPVPG